MRAACMLHRSATLRSVEQIMGRHQSLREKNGSNARAFVAVPTAMNWQSLRQPIVHLSLPRFRLHKVCGKAVQQAFTQSPVKRDKSKSCRTAAYGVHVESVDSPVGLDANRSTSARPYPVFFRCGHPNVNSQLDRHATISSKILRASEHIDSQTLLDRAVL